MTGRGADHACAQRLGKLRRMLDLARIPNCAGSEWLRQERHQFNRRKEGRWWGNKRGPDVEGTGTGWAAVVIARLRLGRTRSSLIVNRVGDEIAGDDTEGEHSDKPKPFVSKKIHRIEAPVVRRGGAVNCGRLRLALVLASGKERRLPAAVGALPCHSIERAKSLSKSRYCLDPSLALSGLCRI